MNKIPVGQTIAYAYGFTFGHIGTVIGLAWLPMLAAQVLTYFLFDATGTLEPPDPAMVTANPSLAGRALLVGVGAYFIALFFNAVVAVAMVRQALGLRTGGALYHMAAGHDEWRMVGGHLRYVFALIGVLLITYFVLLIMGVGGGVLTSMSGGLPDVAGLVGIIVVAVAVALYCAAMLTLVRMGFLLSPSIVAEPGVGGIKRSYDLTRGNFWRIIGVWLGACLPLFLVLCAVEYVLIAPHLDIDWSHLPQTPADLDAFTKRLDASMAELNAEIARQRLPLQALGFVYSVLAAGLFYGAAAFAYRAVVPAGTTR